MAHVTFDQYYEDRKYTVYLDATTGDAIGYSVHMLAHNGKRVLRRLWAKVDGKPMPDRLKAIFNQRGSCELIAAAMNWA